MALHDVSCVESTVKR